MVLLFISSLLSIYKLILEIGPLIHRNRTAAGSTTVPLLTLIEKLFLITHVETLPPSVLRQEEWKHGAVLAAVGSHSPADGLAERQRSRPRRHTTGEL